MRPLWFEFPSESSTFGSEDSFMVGNALLVRPVVNPGVNNINVYLPGRKLLNFLLWLSLLVILDQCSCSASACK